MVRGQRLVPLVSRLLYPAEPHAPGDADDSACPAAQPRQTVNWVTAGHGAPGRLVSSW